MRSTRKARVTNIKPAEIYRMLQLRMNSVMNAGNMKVISFTSIVNCKEKSAHVCNLAKSIVLEGKKVLVIDCNIDSTQDLHYFDSEMEAAVAQEKVQIHNVSPQIIYKVSELPRLNFVSFRSALKTSERSIEKITSFIQKVKEEYDIILIDSPPVGMATEGVKLSTIADATVLVILSGKTPKASAKQIKEMLDAVNVTVLGIILEK